MTGNYFDLMEKAVAALATAPNFDLMEKAVASLAKLASAHHRMSEINEQMLKIARENLEVQQTLARVSIETKAALDKMNEDTVTSGGWSATKEPRLV